MGAALQTKADADRYLQDVAARAHPADQIASAKGLLNSGAINAAEFEQIKATVLS